MTNNLNAVPVASVCLCLCLALNACTFRKGSEEKATPATSPAPTSFESPKDLKPNGIFDALNSADPKSALAYINQASVKELNAYNESGITPLSVALRDHPHYVEALLRKGALPLKPHEKGGGNSLTWAKANGNGLLLEMIQESIAADKERIQNLIVQGDFDPAYKALTSHYFSANEPLQNQLNYLDLVYQNRTLNLDRAVEASTLAVSGGSFPLETIRKVWLLGYEANSTELVSSLLKAKALISKEELTSMTEKSSVNWKLKALPILNGAGISLQLNLAQEQEAYLTNLISSLSSAGINMSQVKKDLVLLESNSAVKVFCGTCIQTLLSEKSLVTSRLDLIAALVETSKAVDSNFLAQILPKITAADLEYLALKGLSRSVLLEQQGLFVAAASEGNLDDQSLRKIDILRKADLKVGASESRSLMLKLFKERLAGNENAALLITQFRSDFLKNKAALGFTPHDLQILASQEVFNIVKTNSDVKNLEMLKELNGKPFDAILIYSRNANNSILELNVNYGYYIWLINKARLNPESLNEQKKLISFAFNETYSGVTFLRKTTDNKDIRETLSDFDLKIIGVLPQSFQAGSRLDQIKKTVQIILRPDIINRIDFAQSLEKETQANIYGTWQSRINVYLPEILKMPSTDLTEFLLGTFIGYMDINFSNILDGNEVEVVNAFLQNTPALNNIFKSYLLRKAPRLFVALNTNNMQGYRSFLRGELSSDPLCSGKSANTATVTSAYRGAFPSFDLSVNQMATIAENCSENAKAMIPPTPPADINQDAARDPLKQPAELDRYFSELNRKFRDKQDSIYARLENDIQWLSILDQIKNFINPAKFDKLGLFGLKSEDFPFSSFSKKKYFFEKNLILDSQRNPQETRALRGRR